MVKTVSNGEQVCQMVNNCVKLPENLTLGFEHFMADWETRPSHHWGGVEEGK